jgi:hypothetical protein
MEIITNIFIVTPMLIVFSMVVSAIVFPSVLLQFVMSPYYLLSSYSDSSYTYLNTIADCVSILFLCAVVYTIFRKRYVYIAPIILFGVAFQAMAHFLPAYVGLPYEPSNGFNIFYSSLAIICMISASIVLFYTKNRTKSELVLFVVATTVTILFSVVLLALALGV